MDRWFGSRVLGVVVLLAVGAGRAQAQTLGTFKWQLQPYCNVVIMTLTQQGGVYALDGVDDQCGSGKLAATDGTAFINPDGSVGLGFTVVPSPTGVPVTIDATIDVATLSGRWRDTAGNSGTFAFAPGGGTGGSPRPAGTSVAGVLVGDGLRYAPTSKAGPAIEIDRDEVARELTLTPVNLNDNVGLGALALRAPKPDAYDNTAIGGQALGAITTGDFNSAVGHRAAAHVEDGQGNVAIGAFALQDNISGSRNVALGADALERIRISDGNVALGDAALFQLQLGNNNVGIGQKSGFGLVAGSYNIYIGANGVNLDNYTTRIGSGQQQRAFIGGIRGVQTGIGNAVPVVVDSNGQLGTINSSRRFKDDIQDLGAAGDRVLDLRPVQFRYKTRFADGSAPLQYGLIAEEVAEVLPELVSRSADGQIETVQYQVLPTLLLKQVQRLERERAAMADRLAGLEQELAALRGSTASVSLADPRQK
ncbi:MAG: tail fiber domain-containing protein [Vicinamibacterales bacterium]